VFSIHNHVSLQSQALKELSLCLWTSSSHSNNSLRLDSVYSDLELFDFDLYEFTLGVNFQLKLVLSQLNLILILLFDQFELGLLTDPL
jgi:hypothetical protein